jgi:2-polyprenyl-3-methyl-5-hydroxy-6-metoxy-1,4-benzoquinol methylase
MTASVDPTRFDEMYRDDRTAHGLPAATPWDIGGPQPVVKQLVSLGAVKGEVLDPGTGPGHHAIYYASQGLSSTGIDASPAAIERARANADRAGVPVNFQVADATRLDGFDGRFDTVVDCAFYHTAGGRLEDHVPGTDHRPDQRVHGGVRADGRAQP